MLTLLSSSLLTSRTLSSSTLSLLLSVDRDGTILEKPDDGAHAHAMLTSLSGRQHLVHSGVAVFSSLGPRREEDGMPLPVVSFSETARVTFAPLGEEEIWSYVRYVELGREERKRGRIKGRGYGKREERGNLIKRKKRARRKKTSHPIPLFRQSPPSPSFPLTPPF